MQSMAIVPLAFHNTADAWDGNSCLRDQKVEFMNAFASVASVASSSKSWEAFATVPSVSPMTPMSGCSLEPYFLGSRISSLLSWSTSNGVMLLCGLLSGVTNMKIAFSAFAIICRAKSFSSSFRCFHRSE